MDQNIDDLINQWPEQSQKSARTTIEKYGQPDEYTADMLVWHHNGPWKRTIVHRKEIPHHFPMPHQDVLENVIDYKASLEKYDDVAKFDGSVMLERTTGEMRVLCFKEELNFVSLNLANDVIEGKQSVDDARQAFGKIAAAFMEGKSDPYTQGLQFKVPKGDTGDPDHPVVGGMMKGMVEGMVDKVKHST